jgi:hypothetical protein
MTLYTLGPNENKDGPFAEVHARNEFEAQSRVQSVDTRRNWHHLNAVYCVPVGSTDTRYVAVGEVRIFERFEDLPPRVAGHSLWISLRKTRQAPTSSFVECLVLNAPGL